jgi:hypothetical protein
MAFARLLEQTKAGKIYYDEQKEKNSLTLPYLK